MNFHLKICQCSRQMQCTYALSLSRRMLSSRAFDGDMSRFYDILSQQHQHERGPWRKVLRATQLALDGMRGPLKLLDLASGHGEPGLSIAQSMPHVNVLITDVSEAQVAKAAKRSEGMSNVSTEVVDITDLSFFGDNTFDAITVCYGYMYCEDKQQAFNESYRVLKPGGTLIATYWKTLQVVELSRTVQKSIYQKSTVPAPSIDPLSLSAEGVTRAYLEQAGFAPSLISSDQSTYPFDLGNDKDLVYSLGALAMYPKLQELKRQGKEEDLQRGKDAFWKEMSAAAHISVDERGSHVIDENVFEMVTATK